MIRFRCTGAPFEDARADVAALLVVAGARGPKLPGSARLHATLNRLCRADRFKGKPRETLLYHSPARSPASRYLVVGLGSDPDAEALRGAAAVAARRAAALGARHLALRLPAEGTLAGEDAARLGQAVVEGVLLGVFRFDRYLSTDDGEGPAKLRTVEIVSEVHPPRALRPGMRRGEIVAETTNFARRLVNEPAAEITPLRMAAIARAEAKRLGLRCRVLRLPELRRRGMGGILGVGQGSAQEPCLIHLTYRPARRPRRRVALVGKGITFDSGGLSLKTATGMETMKCDMAGSAAVLAVLRALPALGLPVQVDGLMAMCENMPSGTAQRPGDILRTMSGKTVEVTNTDAEGRLVLADALAYAAALRPDQIIDVATLTGACVVALGPLASGVMGTDQPLVDAIVAAARQAGEKMWPLPLYAEYREMLKSPVADMKNSGDRWGGALTAGLFLKEFVPADMPWAHLDIAGPAFLEREQPYLRRGATGAGVRTLLQHLDAVP